MLHLQCVAWKNHSKNSSRNSWASCSSPHFLGQGQGQGLSPVGIILSEYAWEVYPSYNPFMLTPQAIQELNMIYSRHLTTFIRIHCTILPESHPSCVQFLNMHAITLRHFLLNWTRQYNNYSWFIIKNWAKPHRNRITELLGLPQDIELDVLPSKTAHTSSITSCSSTTLRILWYGQQELCPKYSRKIIRLQLGMTASKNLAVDPNES